MDEGGDATKGRLLLETERQQGLSSLLRTRWSLSAWRALALAVLALGWVRTAWISDDALITLRSALNMTHGWGPGFNATEAVQSYTHPLWFLLWSALGSASGDWIVSVFVLSAICFSAACAVALWSARSLPAISLAFASLLLGNAVLEYGSSGLENPLAALVVALLVTATLRKEDPVPGSGAWVGLLAAATVLVRMDLVLLVLPAVAAFVWSCRHRRRELVLLGICATTPIGVWLAWSQAAYAALLPNTFAGKRNVNIPLAELVHQGTRYFGVSLTWDLITAAVFVTALIVILAWGSSRARLWLVGVVAYSTYVVIIGGDFMAGRFLAVPALACVVLLARTVDDLRRDRSRVAKSLWAGAIAVALVAGIVQGRGPVVVSSPVAPRWDSAVTFGIADERGFYMWYLRGLGQMVSLRDLDVRRPEPQLASEIDPMEPLVMLRSAANAWPDAGPDGPSTTPVDVGVTCGWLGTLGVLAGPRIHWIDTCGLADRVLAETTYSPPPSGWRIGHFERPLPMGYLDAVRVGDPSLVDDALVRSRVQDLWARIR